MMLRERGTALDSGERFRGFNTYLCGVLSLSKDKFTPRKVLVIPRKRWLRPDMTEKLFTFLFSLMSLSRLFHSCRNEPIGRWGETGVPWENHLTHPQAELGLSHIWPVRGSNLHQSQRCDDQMIKSAEIQRPHPLGHGGRQIVYWDVQR